MYNFCTLFDSNYLTRGLAMYESLQRHCADFHLYVVAFDDACFEMLNAMQLPRLTVIGLHDFEDERLLTVKPSRTKGEYCWTSTPHVMRYVIETYGLQEVTYLDSDIYFFADPAIQFEEFERSGGSVLITEHRYTPEYDQSAESGIYCVQFVTFKADARGLAALGWWQERCLEWCYNRIEDGKFGDQKYLDDWTTRFAGVHVLEHRGGGVAPWNVQQYRIELNGTELLVDGEPLVFYHFHQYRIYEGGVHDLGDYRLAREVIDLLYRPYVKALDGAEKKIIRLFPQYKPSYAKRGRKWTSPFRDLFHRIKGTYNVYKSL